MTSEFEVHPPRKILVVVTVGGSTNSAPILEICRILAERGHTIDFATLAAREGLVKPYPFVSAVHIVGRAITAPEDEQLYMRLSQWDNRSYRGRKDYLQCKKFYDSFWPETYRGLKHVVLTTKPNFIFADYQLDAARDVATECCIPLAMLWPQMPWLLAPQSWIPGVPGTQTRCLTSEHASMYDRVFEQTYFLRYAPNLIDLYTWTKKLRRANGVNTMPSLKPHPDHLVFVNSFFGFEPPKPLPPLMLAAGPVLSETWAPLDEASENFLQLKKSVAYVAFGTHVILALNIVEKLLEGLADAMRQGHIDGVNVSSSWLFLEDAPQRALLNHQSVTLFLTHAGPSSANEAIFHGVSMLSMAIYGDQIHNSMRLVEAGVALAINKHSFTASEVTNSIESILTDTDGEFSRNVQRMQRIATVASRRKHVAADLVEEHMYDWELRFEHEWPNDTDVEGLVNGGRGKELGKMHLQTADARMS
ncbi:glycosyltransferase family 1 protein [Xylona heveae TC161]|uniref:Glycosyltransferase family 1 protein n=1 Tax=Xylona heveae (strain CBS 132557 / TC161) TaxID=1328760 RepID=A0A165GEJ9_XYLHT|nr:glycosyltransferase family 1 protein [Xylona heveae TC161]KZF22094.1 glycosyltransferase family 1 protein [Xylona heveae TC161]